MAFNEKRYYPAMGEPLTELPVEHELLQDAWYQSADKVYLVYGRQLDAGSKPWFRMAPAARYEPPKPETPEPTGLGAVVRDSRGRVYVKAESGRRQGEPELWHCNSIWYSFAAIKPYGVEVLSEGVEL